MAGPAPTVAVVGMAALRRDIKKMGEDLSGPLYQALKEAGAQAAEPVAARARSTITKGDTGRLAGDIRVAGQKTGAAVRMGRATIRYAGWIEFGGRRPDGSSRPYLSNGRYLFPAAVGLADVAAARYSDALDRILANDALWTNTTDNGETVHD